MEYCRDNGVCKHYNGLLLNVFPYAVYDFKKAVDQVCFVDDCFDFNNKAISARSLDEIKSEARNSADFIYPARGFSQDETYDEFYFMPYLRHPGFVYITQVKQTTFQIAIQSCLNLFPLFIIFIMMAILFGFIVWILESRYKESEFTKSFPIGWFKGIWWSFISMTTQGPEATPNSIILRFLTIPWLMVAIVLIGLMTSIITSAMVKQFSTPTMEGKKVGTQAYNAYNELAILRQGGVPKIVGINSTFDELDGLYELLLNGQVDGLLFDKYSFRHYSSYNFKNKPNNVMVDLDNRFLNTPIKSIEDDMFYGVLVRNKTLFEFLKVFLKRKYLNVESRILKQLDNEFLSANKDEMEKYVGPLAFTIDEPYIVTGLIVLASMIGFCVFLGLFYELTRKKPSNTTPSNNEDTVNQVNLENRLRHLEVFVNQKFVKD